MVVICKCNNNQAYSHCKGQLPGGLLYIVTQFPVLIFSWTDARTFCPCCWAVLSHTACCSLKSCSLQILLWTFSSEYHKIDKIAGGIFCVESFHFTDRLVYCFILVLFIFNAVIPSSFLGHGITDAHSDSTLFDVSDLNIFGSVEENTWYITHP